MSARRLSVGLGGFVLALVLSSGERAAAAGDEVPGAASEAPSSPKKQDCHITLSPRSTGFTGTLTVTGRKPADCDNETIWVAIASPGGVTGAPQRLGEQPLLLKKSTIVWVWQADQRRWTAEAYTYLEDLPSRSSQEPEARFSMGWVAREGAAVLDGSAGVHIPLGNAYVHVELPLGFALSGELPPNARLPTKGTGSQSATAQALVGDTNYVEARPFLLGNPSLGLHLASPLPQLRTCRTTTKSCCAKCEDPAESDSFGPAPSSVSRLFGSLTVAIPVHRGELALYEDRPELSGRLGLEQAEGGARPYRYSGGFLPAILSLGYEWLWSQAYAGVRGDAGAYFPVYNRDTNVAFVGELHGELRYRLEYSTTRPFFGVHGQWVLSTLELDRFVALDAAGSRETGCFDALALEPVVGIETLATTFRLGALLPIDAPYAFWKEDGATIPRSWTLRLTFSRHF